MVKKSSYIDEMDYSGKGYTEDYNGVIGTSYLDTDEDDYDISSDIYDDEENDAAAQFIKTMEEKSKPKPKKKIDNDDNDDDDDDDDDSITDILHEEDDKSVLQISTFLPQILGAKTDEFYTTFMSRINKKLKEIPEINTLDFTDVEIDDYKSLKERIESNNENLTCIRSVLVDSVTSDNRPIIYMQDLLNMDSISPLDNIDEICLSIKQVVRDNDFVLKYNITQDLTKASNIILAACIVLTFKGKVTLDTTNISVGIDYNKAIASLMLPYNDDPLKSIEVIKNYYAENFRKGQLVIICDEISIYNMMSTGYAAIVESINSELITVKKIPTCEILSRHHKKGVPFLRTSIRYSDINILKSLVLPIELTEEYPIVKTAIKDESFRKEIDLSLIEPLHDIKPNITPQNIQKTYYALINGISHVDRAFLSKLRQEALIKNSK